MSLWWSCLGLLSSPPPHLCKYDISTRVGQAAETKRLAAASRRGWLWSVVRWSGRLSGKWTKEPVAPLAWVSRPLWGKQWTSGLAGDLTGSSGRWDSHRGACLLSINARLTLVCVHEQQRGSVPRALMHPWPTEPVCTHRRGVGELAERRARADVKRARSVDVLPAHTQSRKQREASLAQGVWANLGLVFARTLSYADMGMTPRKAGLKIKTRRKIEGRPQELYLIWQTGFTNIVQGANYEAIEATTPTKMLWDKVRIQSCYHMLSKIPCIQRKN